MTHRAPTIARKLIKTQHSTRSLFLTKVSKSSIQTASWNLTCLPLRSLAFLEIFISLAALPPLRTHKGTAKSSFPLIFCDLKNKQPPMDCFSEDLFLYLRVITTHLIKSSLLPLSSVKILSNLSFPVYCHYFHLNEVLSGGTGVVISLASNDETRY